MVSEARGSILLVGVGGQGVVLASAVAADVALRAGCDVKQSEVHGMAQRGGIVSSHLRFGPRVASPLIEPGQADAVVAFEWNEGLRWLPYLRPGAPLIVNLQRIVPPGACVDRLAGASRYPGLAIAALSRQVADLRVCDALALATQAGSPRVVSAVLLGVLASLLPFPDQAWLEALQAKVPRGTFPVNERAFLAGRRLRYPDETLRHAVALNGEVCAAGDALALPHGGKGGQGASANGRVPVAPRPQVEVIEAWCKGCDICVRACPERVLALTPQEKVAVVRPQACTACRLCELLCPDFAILVREVEVAHAR